MSKSRERRKEEGEMNLIVNVAGAIQILKTCRSQKNLPRDIHSIFTLSTSTWTIMHASHCLQGHMMDALLVGGSCIEVHAAADLQ